MRCHGLTVEHHRCEAQAVDRDKHCARHHVDAALVGAVPAIVAAPVFGLSLFRRTSQVGVQDRSNLGLPRWIRRCTTAQLTEHVQTHPDAMTRWMCAFALRKRRDPLAIDPLWSVLDHDPSSLVRQQVAVALGKIGTYDAVAPLTEALFHDGDAGVRQACAIALGNLGFRSIVPDLASALMSERAAFARWDCVLALGQLGDRDVEPLLVRMERDERAQVVRDACAQALAEIRRRESRDRLGRDPDDLRL